MLLDPDNKAGKAEQAKLKKARREYAAKSREISKNIANKLFSSSSSSSSDTKKQTDITTQVRLAGEEGIDRQVPVGSSSNEDAVDKHVKDTTIGKQETAVSQIVDEKVGEQVVSVLKEEAVAMKDTAATTISASSSSLPFLYLVVTSAVVLVISLLIAVYISYKL